MVVRQSKQGQSLQALRSANAAALLSAVWNHSPISRSDLAQVTGLAPASITRLTRELTDAGLIHEVSKGKSSGGRQPTLLALNEHAGLVIGIDLSGLLLRGRAADLTSTARADLTRPFDALGPDALWRQVEQLIVDLLADPAVRGQRLLGIGVSVPGTVDLATGLIIDSTNLQVTNYALGTRLEARFGLPVFIEHDTAAAALAEKHFGAGRGVANLVYVTISSGIGAGIVVADELYRGEGGAAGELGHIIVERDGQICPCGRRGCLETVASGPAIVASAQRMLDQGGTTLISQWMERQQQRLTVEAVAWAAQQNDRVAQAILASAADYLALALSTLVCILDIKRIIIGGEVAQAGSVFLEPLQSALHRYELSSNIPSMVPAQLGADAACIGVSMVTLQHLLSQVHSDKLV